MAIAARAGSPIVRRKTDRPAARHTDLWWSRSWAARRARAAWTTRICRWWNCPACGPPRMSGSGPKAARVARSPRSGITAGPERRATPTATNPGPWWPTSQRGKGGPRIPLFLGVAEREREMESTSFGYRRQRRARGSRSSAMQSHGAEVPAGEAATFKCEQARAGAGPRGGDAGNSSTALYRSASGRGGKGTHRRRRRLLRPAIQHAVRPSVSSDQWEIG